MYLPNKRNKILSLHNFDIWDLNTREKIKVIRIGICDDDKNDRTLICNLCKQYFSKNEKQCKFTFWASGEEVLEYCQCWENERIDLLFLDIEMSGVSGIEVKDRIIKQDMVWRIVFVSSYKERVFESFGLKTLGFVVKPPEIQDIGKWIDVVLDELGEEQFLELKGSNRIIRLEELEYFEAYGNYTKMFLHPSSHQEQPVLLPVKLGDIEKELRKYPIIRVHKSYLINLMNVMFMHKEIELRDLPCIIPIGRKYKVTAKKEYMEFVKHKVRKRI